jgi:RND family efflux transporter MFP subunit
MKKFIVLSGIYAVFLFSACSSEKIQQNTNEKFQVTKPVIIDTVYKNEYVAEIQAVKNIELRARISGYLDNVHVDEGGFVKKGQILFTISDKEYKEALAKSLAISKSISAEIKVAELEVQNTKRLVEKKVVSQTELEILLARLEGLKAKADEARADESNAELNLSYTIIKAPFDGVINRIPNKTGSLIDEGMLLTTISDNQEIFAWFNLSEIEYIKFVTQNNSTWRQEVTMLMSDNTLFPNKGIIETAESEIDKSTGNIAFRARFANPNLLLKHGSSGKIVITNKLAQALVIPQKSTFEIQGKLFVYVLNNDNVIQMKSITPIYRIPHLYVIDSGIDQDDIFLYEGIQRVKEGDKIIPEAVSMNKIIAELAKQ